jgi:hypothetical protein
MNNYGNKQESETDNDNPIASFHNMISSSDMNNNDPVEQASGDIKEGTNTSDSLPDDGGDAQRQEYTDRNGQHHPIAEFLYQLTKMLTDDNVEIIEWVDGRIKVHYPERLEGEVLHKYFRHSKFASFQRQLNYFGFRKIAGKGKMSPCSYVNEGATSDIRSLLLIKRKTNGSAARKAAMHQRAPSGTGNNSGAGTGAPTGPLPSQGMNPALAGMNFSSLAAASGQPMNVNSQAFTNAMALLSENALRASLGRMQQQQQNQGQNQGQGLGGNNMSAQQTMNILALQQQQLHQQQQNEQLQQFHQQQQQQQQQDNPYQQNSNHQHLHQQLDGLHSSNHGHGHNATNHSNTPTLEQLHAQLAASLAAKQQKPINATSLSASALNLATSMSANSAHRSSGGQTSGTDNPASAALKAQMSSTPATAAMDAASATTNANGFESSANLQSLLSQNGGMHRPAPSFQAPGPRQGSLLNRLPSANTIFPENMSTASFGNLLGSSNRLSSLLSLNSFLGSREPSMADFAAANGMPPNMSAQQFAAEFAASGASGVSQPQSYAEAKYRSN